MKITFWGTRGSIPTPGGNTIRYGGNTPCIELRLDDGTLFILDAGTGIRLLGEELMKEIKLKATILISHTHWDHIQGLPFFRPAAVPGNEFTIVGGEAFGASLKKVVSNQMKRSYFPIRLKEMPATFRFFPIKEERFQMNGATIESMYVNHPTYAFAFKITHNEKTIIYITDNEPIDHKTTSQMGVRRAVLRKYLQSGTDPNQRLYDFCRGADLLIHDATYTPDEYVHHIGWGHSHYLFPIQVAREAEVKHCVLFHHQPDRSDDDIDNILAICQREMKRAASGIICSAAAERETITL
ncbi:MAG: MBL fold metallo-hydrolase [Bacteroidota bacterium]